MTLEQIVLVSDLHLGAGDERDPFHRDGEFVALCNELAGAPSPAAPGARRLAVLGDFLELLGVRAGDEPRLTSSATVAVGRLERIVQAHREVFGAIADLVDAGWGVDFVVGNHDIELVRPEVGDRLRELLDRRGAGAGVRVHPWILHVPGVLYAEHGHQYHDINWFPELVWAAGRQGDRPVRHPLAAHLGGHRPALAAAAAGHGVDRVLGTRDPRRRRYRREALAQLAGEVGLAAGTLRSIDHLAAGSSPTMARRLARQLARPAQEPAPYLWQAAAEIDRILRAGEGGCAVYAFGHSHVAERRPLSGAGEEGPVYLNAGTWSCDVRGPLRDAGAHEQATFAVVDCAEGQRLVTSLRCWGRTEGVVTTDVR